MADADAADGWDMEFDDDNLDIEHDVVKANDGNFQEKSDLAQQLKVEAFDVEEKSVEEESPEHDGEAKEEPIEDHVKSVQDEEKPAERLQHSITSIEPVAIDHAQKDVEIPTQTVDEDRQTTKQQSNVLPVPNQNGHTDQAGTIAKLQAQLRGLQLKIDQKDEELTTLHSRGEPVIDNNDNETIKALEQKLEEAETERDDAKQQLEDFLSKISSFKNVVRNYKAAQEELEEMKEQLTQVASEKDEAKAELAATQEKYTDKDAEIKKLSGTISQLQTESSDLNGECDRLSQQLTILRREFQAKDESFQDEKYSLENEMSRLAKKINEHKSEYNELELAKEEIAMENKNLALVIEELKGKVDSKDAEVSQFTKMVDDITAKSESSIKELNSQSERQKAEYAKVNELLQQAQAEIVKLSQINKQKEEQIAKLQEEASKLAELKEEVHSKQLIIGKLRHEAIILNEHLTKSLSMLKQQLSNTDNTVDRELISNVFLNFLQIPRGDTKKFEALLLISALLDWDEPRKVQAGLSHNFSKSKDAEGRPFRQSFVSLWTDFLEKESSNKAAK